MKFIYLILLSFFLLLCGCIIPDVQPDISPEHRQFIQSALDILGDDTEARAILDDLNGIRNVVYPAAMASFEAVIIDRFEDLGLSVLTQPVTVQTVQWPAGDYDNAVLIGPYTMNNIIAVKQGENPDLAPVLITGHWDSVCVGPGIDDNASSCAGVLEAARALRGFRFERTIKYILFGLEEEGLLGSYYYTGQMTEIPKSVINFEMIGYTSESQTVLPMTDVLLGFPVKGDFAAVFAADFSHDLAMVYAAVFDSFLPGFPYYIARTGSGFPDDPFLGDILRSDHTPFWEMGIPAVMVTDTANLRNPYYHTPEDTIDKIDFGFMMNCIRSGTAVLCVEAGIISIEE